MAAATPRAEVARAEAHALDGEEIFTLLPGINVTTYPKLVECTRLQDLLDNPQQAAAVLFVTDKTAGGGNQGHWLALFKRSDGKIVYFDPFGKMPDTHRTWLPAGKRAALGEGAPLLMPLITAAADDGVEVVASSMPVQKQAPDIATCGRHVVFRIKNRDASDDEYWAMITANPRLSADKFVTLVTQAWLDALRGKH